MRGFSRGEPRGSEQLKRRAIGLTEGAVLQLEGRSSAPSDSAEVGELDFEPTRACPERDLNPHALSDNGF